MDVEGDGPCLIMKLNIYNMLYFPVRLTHFELQKNEIKQLKRMRCPQNLTPHLPVEYKPGAILPAPVDKPLAAMDGVRLSRQSAVGPVQDQPRREAQRRF